MNISIDEFIKIENTNINIIDIRNNFKYLEQHIKGAINIEERNLRLYPYKYLDKTSTYYLYCDEGHRSKDIVKYLRPLGYKVFSIEGGFNNYLLRK